MDTLIPLPIPPKKRVIDRFVSREGRFNLSNKGIGFWTLYKADSYRVILNLPWWKLLTVSFLIYTCVNLFFGFLYWIRLNEVHGARTFLDAFWFSMQTMNAIGYGSMYPDGYYVHCLTFFQSWLGLLIIGGLTAVVFTKLSRPSRLRHTIQFSTVAVINEYELYRDPVSGDLVSGTPCLAFRVANMRKRQVCNPIIRLLLLRRVTSEMDSVTNRHKKGFQMMRVTEDLSDGDFESHEFRVTHEKLRGISSSSRITDGFWTLEEMDFEVNRQGTRQGTGPLLPFPWLIVHRIDKHSPLYNQTHISLENSEAEIICLIEGTDELTSLTFQARWSYLPHEILWGHRFVDCISKDRRGKFQIDFNKISLTTPVDSSLGYNVHLTSSLSGKHTRQVSDADDEDVRDDYNKKDEDIQEHDQQSDIRSNSSQSHRHNQKHSLHRLQHHHHHQSVRKEDEENPKQSLTENQTSVPSNANGSSPLSS